MAHLLEAKNITKRFGGLTAVDNVSFHVDEGEVVALVGDNGAGKSTLIKIISGVHKPDEGEIFLNGQEIHIDSPIDAISHGIETIYQDLALAENMDVPSNIFLGRERTKKILGFINVVDHEHMSSESAQSARQARHQDPFAQVQIRNLSGGQRQHRDFALDLLERQSAHHGRADSGARHFGAEKSARTCKFAPETGHRDYHYKPSDVRCVFGGRQDYRYEAGHKSR